MTRNLVLLCSLLAAACGSLASRADAGGDADDGGSEHDMTDPDVDVSDDDVDADSDEWRPDAVRGSCPVQVDAGLPPCLAVDPISYGDCGLPLGAAFDGSECVEVTGCECTGPGCPSFTTTGECAVACAAAGFCRDDKKILAGMSELSVGTFCDALYACFDGDVDPSSRFASYLPRLLYRCRQSGYCSRDAWGCSARGGGSGLYVDESLCLEVCAATLLPEVTRVSCEVELL
jgi:hypothetical protein